MCNGIEYNVMFTCIEYELKKLKKKKKLSNASQSFPGLKKPGYFFHR